MTNATARSRVQPLTTNLISIWSLTPVMFLSSAAALIRVFRNATTLSLASVYSQTKDVEGVVEGFDSGVIGGWCTVRLIGVGDRCTSYVCRNCSGLVRCWYLK